jgi:hypothetical protein
VIVNIVSGATRALSSIVAPARSAACCSATFLKSMLWTTRFVLVPMSVIVPPRMAA